MQFYLRIKQFGAWDALGRALYVREMNMVTVIENVVRAYQSRAGSQNFGAWAKSESALASILAEAEVMAIDSGWDGNNA